ncbi:MAG TPA: hypothetical protein VJT73_20105 [Polyangiaceae bacterium]|nr:hypothetical protein [Polyangiaceae bacterium]
MKLSVDPKVECAFVAALYLLGEGCYEPCASAEARALARALASPERETRAVSLAREVARIAVALHRQALR